MIRFFIMISVLTVQIKASDTETMTETFEEVECPIQRSPAVIFERPIPFYDNGYVYIDELDRMIEEADKKKDNKLKRLIKKLRRLHVKTK